MIENIAIIDTETTGLDAKKNLIIEIGLIVLNVKTNSIMQMASTLIKADRNEAEYINCIPVNALQAVNQQNEIFTINTIDTLIKNSDAIVAHNAKFDKSFLKLYPPLSLTIQEKLWICSKENIHWGKLGSLKLKDIAEYMGVPVFNAHRALGDCIMLANCLQKLDTLDIQLKRILGQCGR